MEDSQVHEALIRYQSDIDLYTVGLRRMLTSGLYRNLDLPERIGHVKEEALSIIHDERMPPEVREKLRPRIDTLQALCDRAEEEFGKIK